MASLNKDDIARRFQSCLLCGRSELNQMLYGEIFERQNVFVHHFCLLFSEKLYAQNNIESENAFDLYDIDEIKKYSAKYVEQKCVFCEQASATIKCSHRGCPKYFHFICAFDSEKCTLKFDDLYPAFCPAHSVRNPNRYRETDACVICLNEMGERTICGQINLNCRKYMWMHRLCAIRLAANRGYGFQCPICGETDKFQKFIRLRGVFVPCVDILTQIHNEEVREQQTKYCEAEICLYTPCLEKRDPSRLTEENDAKSCTMCGKNFHKQCSEKQGRINEEQMFVCSSCLEFSDYEVSFSSSSAGNSLLNRSFDLGSECRAGAEPEIEEPFDEEHLSKKFKFDREYEFVPSKGYNNHEWRKFKLNYFMNSLRYRTATTSSS